MNLLEIQTRDGANFVKVSESIFRSWTGPRKMNGKPYLGPRYNYLTDTLIDPSQKVKEAE